MSRKFIPNGDFDFAVRAESFARHLVADPARYEIPPEDAERLDEAVKQFRSALQAARGGGRSEVKTQVKDDARAAAERIMRRLGHLVRSNLRLDAATKMSLGIHPRKEKPKVIPCPQEPPRLRFVRALHEGNGATPMHELSFMSLDCHRAKPAGAVRLELFADLVPPEEPIPAHPGANLSSRPWYLRSFTRSPIVLVPPMPRVPMRVVYWARWADSMGNVGPFSATAAGWIEGGVHHCLPGGVGIALGGRKEVKLLDGPAMDGGPANRELRYRIAVIEAQIRSIAPAQDMPAGEALPAPAEPKQLAAPRQSEAA